MKELIGKISTPESVLPKKFVEIKRNNWNKEYNRRI